MRHRWLEIDSKLARNWLVSRTRSINESVAERIELIELIERKRLVAARIRKSFLRLFYENVKL